MRVAVSHLAELLMAATADVHLIMITNMIKRKRRSCCAGGLWTSCHPNKLTASRITTMYVATHGTVNSSPMPRPCDLKLRNQTNCSELATDTPCPKTRLDNAMRASSAVHLCATSGFETAESFFLNLRVFIKE